MLWVSGVLTGDERIGPLVLEGVLAPRGARAQHVQADSRDHRRQPAAEVLDPAGVRAAQPQPALLDRVIRLVDRAEHPEGQRAQVPAVGLELVGQHVVSVHCHILR